jgi:putative ATP-dependent endonuclease of the OLD family
MLINHVGIENFRGIKSLDWHLNGSVLCLLGPGDSTKTTILDAIELALLPRWNVPFSDADFFRADITSAIQIHVTVGELPDNLLSEDRCGLYLRGYQPFKPLNDDPEDGWDPVITIRLRVTDDLEPHWELVKDGVPEPKPLSWRDRERLCMARLGNDVERHLTWSRGSALSRITDDSADAGAMLALVNRAANEAIFNSTQEQLDRAAARTRKAAVRFGVQLTELTAGLDNRSQGFGTGALALHDSNRVPVRGCGLGSRRLIGLAIQHEGLGADSILLIDEIEHGLEPHRIRRVIKRICEDRLPSDVPNGTTLSSGRKPTSKGQVITTTHSPTPVMALDVTCLRFVCHKNGMTSVKQVDSSTISSLQPIARKFAHAFLAKKVLVCEGKTEEAILRVLDDLWASSHNGSTFATCGVVPFCGEGRSNAPVVASEFRKLGYEVCYFGDSDEPLSVSEDELEAQGVFVALWSDNMAIEERVSTDLPLPGVQEVIGIATALTNEGQVRVTLEKYIGKKLPNGRLQISEWIEDGIDEATARKAIGTAAKSNDGKWFKNITAGEELGQVIATHLASIPMTPLARTLAVVEEWVHAE